MRSGSSIILRRSTGGWILLWVVLFVFSLWTIFPLFWAVVTSFKFTGDAYDPTFIPWVQFKPTLQGWRFVLITAGERTFRSLKNSIVIAFFSSAAVLFLGSMAGYALARFVFRKWKNKDIAVWILSNRMFPPVAVLIPYFLIMRSVDDLVFLSPDRGLFFVDFYRGEGIVGHQGVSPCDFVEQLALARVGQPYDGYPPRPLRRVDRPLFASPFVLWEI